MLYTIVAVLVLVLDQAVKYFTVSNIPPQAIGDACIPLIPGVIHMTNVQNYGAAFSILENARAVLIVVSVLFIIGIIMLISMDIIHTKFGRWTAVLVMAGALGNCIDRILLGYVVDMFEFELFSFAVFNVADVFITVCGILFCIHVLVYREPEEERNAVPRPEKKHGRLFASRRQPQEDEDTADEPAEPEESEEPEEEAPRRRPGKFGSLKKKAAWAAASLEDDWDDDDEDEEAAPAPRPKRGARAAYREEPVPPKSPERPSRRRTAPAVEDDWDDIPPAPTSRSRRAPAAPAETAPVVHPDGQPDGQPDSAGFDEYSLEDILSEFRDI